MNWQAELRQAIMDHFSESDIKALCFDMGIDYDELSGDTKTEKVISLIDYFDHLDEIPKLIAYCSQYRPNVPWLAIEQEAIKEDEQARPIPPRIDSRPAADQRPTMLIAAAAFIILALLIVIVAFIILPSINKPDEDEVAAARTVVDPLPAVNAPAPTETATLAPTETASPAATETASPAPTETASPAPTETASPTATETASPAPTETASSAATETASPAPTETASPAATESPVPTSTEETLTIFCPGAQPARLSIGDEARVAVLSGANVRSRPGAAKVWVGFLGLDRTMEVTDGPECSDGELWYKIEGEPFTNSAGESIQVKGWVAEERDGEYLLEPLN